MAGGVQAGVEATKPRILVVDDEEPNLEFVVRALRHRFDVRTARSGEEAVNLLESAEFACVICDQRMPGMQGAELLAHAARIVPQSVRMLMTAYTDNQALIDAINTGRSTTFLRKPFAAEELNRALDSALEFQKTQVRYDRLVRELLQKTRELEEQKRLLAMTVDERTAHLARVVERLQDLVFRDALTGVYNHRYFQERLEQELGRAERYGLALAILLIDVDRFRVFNQRYRHLAGDAALKAIADLLRGDLTDRSRAPALRTSDIVARFGGEEFVVLLPETTAADAAGVAERLRQHVERTPFELDAEIDANLSADLEAFGARSSDPELPVEIVEIEEERPDPAAPLPGPVELTVSIGVAAFPEHGRDRERLLASAARALDEAKRAGRNRVHVARERDGSRPSTSRRQSGPDRR